MALRVKDDAVQLEAIIGTNSAQTVAEGTVTIPSSMLAADRIVKVTAIPHIKEKWVEEDRVNVEGVIAVTLVYTGRSNTGQAYYGNLEIADGVPFSHFVDIPGVLPNMQSQCDANILDLQSTVRSDGRTVDLDLVLEISATARESQELTLVTDAMVSAPDKLKVAKDTLRIEDLIGEGTAQAELREMIPLSSGSTPILRLLELQGQFRIAEKRVAVDRGIISGTMSYKAICAAVNGDTGEEQVLVYRWDNISRVELSAEIPGSRSGMIAYPQIAPPVISGRLLNEGQMLAVEGVLAAVVKVVQPRDVTVVTELSSEGDLEVGVRREVIRIQQLGDTAVKDIYVDGTVELSESRPPLERLLDMEAKAAITSASVVGGRALVTGYVDLGATYVGRADDFSQPVYHVTWSNAGILETSISVPIASALAGADVVADVTIQDVRAELLSRETIGFHVTATVSCRLQQTISKEVVAEAVDLRKFKGRSPTYTCVTLQPDDTLWKLATKYRTSIESLLEGNPVLAEAVTAGDLPSVGGKLFITKSGISSLV
ncbi:MAG: DUF3794 domain-containing protein [Firmicutes bacterium]|nr:DUF3794 domain-containing protein [Bacillota bacterium]